MNLERFIKEKWTIGAKFGGDSERITLVGKGSHHGTHDVFVQALDIQGVELPHITTFETEAQITQMINKRIKYGIAFGSLGGLNHEDIGIKFDLLTVDGQHPIENSSVQRMYPFSRPLNLVIATSMMEEPSVQAFVNFLLSEDGQHLLKAHGFTPLAR